MTVLNYCIVIKKRGLKVMLNIEGKNVFGIIVILNFFILQNKWFLHISCLCLTNERKIDVKWTESTQDLFNKVLAIGSKLIKYLKKHQINNLELAQNCLTDSV
jgi:hypothetical protein